jgi:hypothetical protein
MENPNRWDSRQIEMKFDIAAQLMIAYAVRHISLYGWRKKSRDL